MTKDILKKLILFTLCGIVFLSSFICFKTTTFASESQTVTITGEGLYNLLSTGVWTSNYTVGSSTTANSNVALSQNSDGYTVYTAYPSTSKTGALSGGTIDIDFNADYSACTYIQIELAGAYLYSVGSLSASVNTTAFQTVNAIAKGNTDISLTQGLNNGTVTFTAQYYPSNSMTVGSSVMTASSSFTAQAISGMTVNTVCDISIPAQATAYYRGEALLIKSITLTFESSSSGGGGSSGSDSEALQAIAGQLDRANYIATQQYNEDKQYHDTVTTPTDEDKTALDEIEQGMQDAQDKADEFKDAMGDVETPEVEDVLPDDSVDNILQDDNIVEGQPYIFSILESLQSITWLLLMILISVTVGVIRYIIYGKS